jgi:hypothetical protein
MTFRMRQWERDLGKVNCHSYLYIGGHPMNLIDSAIAAPPLESLSPSIQPTGLKSDDVDQVPAMHVDWKWYLNCALMNLAGWLLLFSTLFFLTNYMQEEPASHILNSDPAPHMARY